MCRNLTFDDKIRVRDLTGIRQRNNEVSWMLCDFLNNNPRAITKELMDSVRSGESLTEEMTYFALLTGFCGLDTENSARDRQLADEYFLQAVRKLDTKRYTSNPYYQNIIIPAATTEHWKLKYQNYNPYEAFIYKDLINEPDLREYPCIGFFSEDFIYPSVMENDHEWMSIKPSEIETSQPAIDSIEGKVITFGLGLGYFTFMATLKQSVQSITVVERDKEVIRLFENYILPQFKYKEKVEIICADAFEYAGKQMPERNFDYAFVDLWHDVSDGLDMYLRMKKLEHFSRHTKYIYWIEGSLLSGFRWQIFDWVINNATSYDEILKCLSNEFLRKLAETQF